MPSDWSDHPLIQRLLDADEPPDLTDKELALLEACLKQPLQPSRIQRENRRTGRSEYKERRKWLKLILDYNRNRRAAPAGDRSAGERGDPPQKEAESLAEAPPRTPPAGPEATLEAKRKTNRPPRLWTRTHCPSCGRDGIEFVSQSEFSRRWKEYDSDAVVRTTVSSRIKDGRYCADANADVPWCPLCKHKTPEGQGVNQPVEKPSVSDYVPTEAEKQKMLDWVEDAVCRRFDTFQVDWLNLQNPPEPLAVDCFQEAFEKVLQAMHERRGALTRDEVESLAEDAIQGRIRDHQDAKYRPRFRDGASRPEDE
ncbi:MAG: hypothetical protein R6V05_14765 [Candidatus Brocadiia bacterium]